MGGLPRPILDARTGARRDADGMTDRLHVAITAMRAQVPELERARPILRRAAARRSPHAPRRSRRASPPSPARPPPRAVLLSAPSHLLPPSKRYGARSQRHRELARERAGRPSASHHSTSALYYEGLEAGLASGRWAGRGRV
jgi:hypothetical protein